MTKPSDLAALAAAVAHLLDAVRHLRAGDVHQADKSVRAAERAHGNVSEAPPKPSGAEK